VLGGVYISRLSTHSSRKKELQTKEIFPSLRLISGSCEIEYLLKRCNFPPIFSFNIEAIGRWLRITSHRHLNYLRFPCLHGADSLTFNNVFMTDTLTGVHKELLETSFPCLPKAYYSADRSEVKAQKDAAIKSIFDKYGYLLADEICGKILHRKKVGEGEVYTLSCDNKEMCCVCVDGVYSHGDTYKEAKKSFLYKRSNRDTSAFREWTGETEISLHDAIDSYRAITGACEGGVRGFCEKMGKLKDVYTVNEVIEITKDCYGGYAYKTFFEKKGEDSERVVDANA
jgi:hypothetical protein